MYCTVTLYHSTRYDNINLPRTIALLEGSAKSVEVIETQFRLTTSDIAGINVNHSFDEISDVDFVKVRPFADAETTTYSEGKKKTLSRLYYVTGIEMLSEGTARLNLELSAYLTLLEASPYYMNAISITATRMTPSHSLKESNTLQEPFSPADVLNMKYLTEIIPGLTTGGEERYNIIGATIDIDNITDTAKAFKDANGADVLYVPSLPLPGSFTSIQLPSILGYVARYLPGEKLFYNNQGLIDGPAWYDKMQNVQSLGIADAIIDNYTIPGHWVMMIGGDAGNGNRGISSLWGKSVEKEINLREVTPPLTDIENINNLKTLKLFLTISVMSDVSGDRADYNWGEIATPGDGRIIKFFAWADPSPNGRPYCQPSYYYGRQIEGHNMQLIQGSPWYKPQMVIPGKSGSMIDSYNVTRNITDVNRAQNQAGQTAVLNTITSAASLFENAALKMSGANMFGGTGMFGAFGQRFESSGFYNPQATNIGGIAGAIGGIGGNILGYYQGRANNLDKINDMITNLNVSNNIYTPTFKTAEGNSLSLCKGNAFIVYSMNLSTNDMIRLDHYLTKYGYAIQPTVTTLSDAASHGRFFSYIEAGNIAVIPNDQQTLDYPGIPLFIRKKLTTELQDGVRIWRTAPDESLYSECNDPDAEEE